MHLRKAYTLREFIYWSRRQLYALIACGSVPICRQIERELLDMLGETRHASDGEPDACIVL
ncbi:hypothetical protein [Burkholderia multivorans]|uniref:hypothetical protein n=1 Tax=Burkholderia multivorans TaxID=87883 RepID=UPI001C21CCA2|nr:hypothetical protein [Burkholderia multivorans]MBU9584041.1 hypothetical protein [Burkholderia multivorans]